VLEALNLPFVHEFAHPDQWGISGALWQSAGGAELPVPVAAEAWDARESAELEAQQAALAAIEARRRAAEQDLRRLDEARTHDAPRRASWGTPEAKAAARAELHRRFDAQRKGRKTGEP
jgi:hypothetical protein